MMEASSSGKISSELMVHFLRNTGSIKNEREASPQRNNHLIEMRLFSFNSVSIDLYLLSTLLSLCSSRKCLNVQSFSYLQA